MGLNTEERQGVVYFTGYEVEHTICHGMFTLFVVGTPPIEEILTKAIIELKQYCYDTQELLSDWDVYAVLARREREVGTYGDEQLNIDYQIAMETLNSKNTNTSS
mgnify:CR=1 FL=1